MNIEFKERMNRSLVGVRSMKNKPEKWEKENIYIVV